MVSKDELSYSSEEEEEEHFTMVFKWRKLRTALVLSLFLCTVSKYLNIHNSNNNNNNNSHSNSLNIDVLHSRRLLTLSATS